MLFEAVEEFFQEVPIASPQRTKKTSSRSSIPRAHLTKSPIVTCLTTDILALLIRFMIQTEPSDLCFESFKRSWAQPQRHFSVFHHVFDPAKVDYNRLLQTAFQVAMQQFFIVPVEVLAAPHLQSLGELCVF